MTLFIYKYSVFFWYIDDSMKEQFGFIQYQSVI